MADVIERAYELARSGDYAKVREIEKRLNEEHFLNVRAQVVGRTLRRELQTLCRTYATAEAQARVSKRRVPVRA